MNSICKWFLFTALLKLIPKNETELYPVCLPDTEELQSFSFEGHQCAITGWGQNHLNGSLFNVLQQATVPILNSSFCKEAYNISEYNHLKIGGGHLCAGEIDGSAGTCIVSTLHNHEIN